MHLPKLHLYGSQVHTTLFILTVWVVTTVTAWGNIFYFYFLIGCLQAAAAATLLGPLSRLCAAAALLTAALLAAALLATSVLLVCPVHCFCGPHVWLQL